MTPITDDLDRDLTGVFGAAHVAGLSTALTNIAAFGQHAVQWLETAQSRGCGPMRRECYDWTEVLPEAVRRDVHTVLAHDARAPYPVGTATLWQNHARINLSALDARDAAASRISAWVRESFPEILLSFDEMRQRWS